jgi:hypothetical protein
MELPTIDLTAHRVVTYTQDEECILYAGTFTECRDYLRGYLQELRKRGRLVTESPSGNKATIRARAATWASYMIRISSPL